MKLLKILSFLILGIFLISIASAMTVLGSWEGGKQSAEINYGESVDFSASFISMSPPMRIKIQLYKQGNLIHTFLNQQNGDNIRTYYVSYAADSNSYENIGNYELRITGTDGINTNSSFLTLTVNPLPDTIPPVITPLGNNSVTIEVFSTYTDAGATAWDDVDGNITSNIVIVNPVNVNVLGTYVITYDVTDSSGNTATQVTRTVYVVDTTSPVITLLGDNPQNITLGYPYVEQGATATDIYDGNLTSNITKTSNVDLNALGTYTITYTVSDSSGNNATAKRVVNVLDTTSPIINIIYPQNGVIYDSHVTKLNYTVFDENLQSCWYTKNSGANVSFSCVSGINIINTISSEGSNTWTVYANDSSGNTASARVTFTVNIPVPDPEPDEPSDKDGKKTKSAYTYEDTDEERYFEQLTQEKPKIELISEEPQPKKSWLVFLIGAIILVLLFAVIITLVRTFKTRK